jgi:NitT/TauT family transport system ATP-binding protein
MELDFPPEEAERQIETLINWGRYVELFAYDNDKEIIFLEASPTLVQTSQS